MRGTGLIVERAGGYCTGIDRRDGPNPACLGCDLLVGTRMDDCGCWQVVRLVPQAVVRLHDPQERPVMDWAELLATGARRARLLADVAHRAQHSHSDEGERLGGTAGIGEAGRVHTWVPKLRYTAAASELGDPLAGGGRCAALPAGIGPSSEP
ncbi:hypothetical protein [Streptacidiphilus albus]|uniref:hypothetical protein n=1 Tax=Streptacidiphilus albus TaxID=105425 RepID=UPI00054C7A59|nr:hypothetical protein [Streptacidiphilus albus]